MKEISASESLVPIGEFKSSAARILRELKDSDTPLVITQNGRPAGVLLSPREFDRLRERQRFLESVAAGISDAEAGRVMSGSEVLQKLARARVARRRR